jgi:cytochrome c553
MIQRTPLTIAVLLVLAVRLCAADGRTGEQVYRQMCARCHGAAGEGVAGKYPDPLVGNRSVAQLARYIAKSMPEDKPGTCTSADAEKVAVYIHDAFYSKVAQERNRPPRIELARLTVRQYREALADLIGSFRPAAPISLSLGERGRGEGDQHGLRAEYYKSRRFRTFDRVLERVDPEIRFDFGVSSPDPGKLDPYEFTMRWTGSVVAPETGSYDFIVRSDHAARLWINDDNRPLIDAWVKSSNDTEFRASLFLLGGRAYPLKLEFSKAKQGVDDSKNNKKRPVPPASLELRWKLPQRADEVIPQRNLLPQTFPELFVATTPFPPDDRSIGYERGTSVSKAWDAAMTDAAIETVSYVVAHLRELSRAGEGADRPQRLRLFCQRFAELAFRRPLTVEHQLRYIDRQFQETTDPDTAVKRSLLLTLKSPRFLYREMNGDAYDTASRLSFGLWDSLPDQALLDAAAKGELATRAQVVRQAERMAADPRTRAKLREFFQQWLKIEHVPDIAKDPQAFPGFDAGLAADLRTSLDLFLEDVLWSEASDFRQLLLSDELFLNDRLSAFYGAALPAPRPFRKVLLPPLDERAGILTHPYLMATFAYTSTTSPIHRGVFLARSVLGQSLRPPPDAFAPLAPDLHPKLTTRERVILQTKPQACQTCHGMINPLGFTLEHFDAVGRYRDQEKGRPIDATGTYQTRSGETVKFAGVHDLAVFLANSPETHDAFIEQLFHYIVKQPVRAFGPRKLADLRQSFVEHRFSVRRLLVEMMAETAPPERVAQR